MAMFHGKGGGGGPEAVTLVGEEANFHGMLSAKGSLRVDGTVEGDITDAVGIEVGKKGRIKGNVAAETITISGVVEGDIVASRSIEVLSGGRVAGNIRTPSLKIEEGATFDGSCAMVPAEEASSSGAGDPTYESAERS